MAYMAVFATLLAVLRWWVDADPLRHAAEPLVAPGDRGFVHLVAALWHFPEPWLAMVAACMSVSVQLASPWVPGYAGCAQRKKVI